MPKILMKFQQDHS